MQHEGKKCIQVQQAFADGATLAELEQHIAYLRSLGAPGDARPRIGVNGDCEVTMMICAVLRRTLQVLHKCPKKEVERPGSGLRWLEFEGKSGMAEESADEVGPVLDAPEPAADSLPELQDKARAINARLLETETAGQDTALVSPVIERITRPTLTGEGRKAPALRFGDLRVQALAGATAAVLFTVTGITNKTLRGLMTGLLHRPYSMNQASYDLSRLARNDLIQRVPCRNRYTLTRDGLLFAHFYTKVYDHVLRPLMAPDRPNAPPELAAALATFDQLAADHIARARVPTAA